MSVLVNKDTRLVVQGITGSAGSFHTTQCMEYGTNVVAGVTPGKAGNNSRSPCPCSIPCRKRWTRKGPTSPQSTFLRPSPRTRYSRRSMRKYPRHSHHRGHPVRDMAEVKDRLSTSSTRLIGPIARGSSPRGNARSGSCPVTFTSRARWASCRAQALSPTRRSGRLPVRARQSTCIGIGGDPINGTNHLDCVKLFNEDPETEAIIMIEEIGGTAEEKPPPRQDTSTSRWPPSCGHDRSSGQAHGPRRGNRVGRQGNGRGQSGSHGGRRHCGRRDAFPHCGSSLPVLESLDL